MVLCGSVFFTLLTAAWISSSQQAPQINGGPLITTLHEDTRNETEVICISCTSPEGNPFEVSDTSVTPPARFFDIFKLPGNTDYCLYYLPSQGFLDYKRVRSYTVQFVCTDGFNSDTSYVEIDIIPNKPPQIISPLSDTCTIDARGTAAGSLIHLNPITVNDTENDHISATFTTTPSSAVTNYIIVKPDDNYDEFFIQAKTDLTAECNTEVTFSVLFSDGKHNSVGPVVMRCNVINKYTAPVIGNLDKVLNVSEDTALETSLITFATDPQTPPISYEIQTSPPAALGLFDVTTTLHDLKLAGQLNYENTNQRNITVIIKANNGLCSSAEQYLYIRVTDANDLPKLRPKNVTKTVYEGQIVVNPDFQLEDEDREDSWSYSIVQGNDKSYFTIDPFTGVINSNNYDTDLNANPTTLALLIQVQDRDGGVDTATLNLVIKDANDNPPEFTAASQQSETFYVSSCATLGAVLGKKLIAADSIDTDFEDNNVPTIIPASNQYLTVNSSGDIIHSGQIPAGTMSSLTVYAQDRGVYPNVQRSRNPVTITVVGTECNTVKIHGTPIVANLRESARIKTEVVCINCTSPAVVRVILLSVTPLTDIFEVDKVEGNTDYCVYYQPLRGVIDYRNTQSFSMQIQCSDSVASVTETAEIRILPNEPPQILSPLSETCTIDARGTAAGVLIHVNPIVVNDIDDDPITTIFSTIPSSAAANYELFKPDNDSDEFFIRAKSDLTAECNADVTFSISLSDGENSPVGPVIMKCTVINKYTPPVILNVNNEIHVDEDTAFGTSLITFETDPKTPQVSYDIQTDPTAVLPLFDVTSTLHDMKLAGRLNYDDITQRTINISIQVNNGYCPPKLHYLFIRVIGKPLVIGDIPAMIIHEDTQVQTDLGVVPCIDRTDVNGQCYECNIKTMNPPGGPFNVWRVPPDPDFHIYYVAGTVISDLDWRTTSSYSLVIQCLSLDGGTVVTRETRIDIQPNQPPRVSDFPGVSRAYDAIADTGTGWLVYQMNVQDADNDPITFALTTEPRVDYFSIRPNGTIMVVKDLRTAVEENVSIRVSVSDGVNTVGPFTVFVAINNLNQRPRFTNSPTDITVFEDLTAGSTIFIFSYGDDDVGNTLDPICSVDPSRETFRFEFITNDGQVEVKLNTSSAQADLLDAERTILYNISCLLNDGYLDSVGGFISLTVLNVNEPPAFSKDVYYCYMEESYQFNGPCSLTDLSVSDPENDAVVEIKLMPSPSSNRFRFNNVRTQLSFRIDYDVDLPVSMPNHEILTLQAVDSSGATGTTQIQVNVIDVNDNAPVFQPETSVFYVDQGQDLGLIGTMSATDNDLTNNTVTFSPSSTGTGSVFIQVLENGDVLYFRDHADTLTGTSQYIYVVAKDSGTPARSSTGTVVVVFRATNTVPSTISTVPACTSPSTNINIETVPVIQDTPIKATLHEETANQTQVVSINCTSPVGNEVVVSLVSVTPTTDIFDVGKLGEEEYSVYYQPDKGPLDDTTAPVYYIEILCSDSTDSNKSVTETVEIQIRKNEPPQIVSPLPDTCTIDARSTTAGMSVHPDPIIVIDPDNDLITPTLTSLPFSENFEIFKPDNNIDEYFIQAKNDLTRECISDITFFVFMSDGKNRVSGAAVMNCVVTNENSAAKIANIDKELTLSEDTALGTSVITFDTHPKTSTMSYEIQTDPLTVMSLFDVTTTLHDLKLAGQLNYEDTEQRNINLSIKANNGFCPPVEQYLYIRVTDANDSPTLGPKDVSKVVNEGRFTVHPGFQIGDEDTDDSWTYSIVQGNDNNYFSINPYTGAVSSTIDYNTGVNGLPVTQTLLIQVKDTKGGAVDSATLTLIILDVNGTTSVTEAPTVATTRAQSSGSVISGTLSIQFTALFMMSRLFQT